MIPIIIVNWNGINDTIECINSVLLQDYSDYHVYLIDNASDNGEGLQLKNLFSSSDKITVLLYSENLGFTGAHLKIWEDLFIDDPDIKYIALLNNDTSIDKSWISKLYTFAQQKQCSIVASKMIQYWDRTKMDNAGHKMLNTGEILPIGHGDAIEEYALPFKNFGGCGGGVLYQTSMLRKIGFFDNYFSTGYEDAELGLRAIVSGYSSWYCPDSIIYHKGGQSIKKIFNEEYTTMIFTSILYSYFKNLSLTDIIINFPFLIFKYSCMFIVDILFFRWLYLRVMTNSIQNTLKNILFIQKKRKQVVRKNSSISSKFTFFLWFDVKRFFNLFIRQHNSSALDEY